MITPFWVVPCLFVIACIILLLKNKLKWMRSSIYGILAFGLFFLLGSYSILESRSSTAGIGFVFLPIIALLPGCIGFLLGKIHTDYLLQKKNNETIASQKISLIILSLLVIAPFIWQGNVMVNTILKNNASDIESARQSEAIKHYTKTLDRLLSGNPGKEKDILSELASKTEDRTKLIPIANNKHASAELLDKLSRSSDLGVVLYVVRNRNTVETTLNWIYKNHTYPFYFYAALSSNPNTPPAILRELYEKRIENTGIARQLAANPKLQEDILNKLTSEPGKYVLRNILNRPDLTCEQSRQAANTIKSLKETDVSWLREKTKNRMKNCIQP